MPLYTYTCPDSHATERLAPRTCEVIHCACGKPAARQSVNHIAFTGFARTPRDQRNYRQSFSEYQEALEDVSYHQHDEPSPDYMAIAKARVANGL